MKLYGTYLSPYTARVLLVARAKGRSLAPLPPPAEGAAREAYLRVNRTGKFPFLDHDGFYLSESAVIADYVDAVTPGPPLWPADPRERAHAALIARFAEAWVTPGLTGVMRDILTGEIPAAASWQLYVDGLRLIDERRRPGDIWLFGNRFGHADAVLIPMLFTAERFDAASGAGTEFRRYPGFRSYWASALQDPIVAGLLTHMCVRADIVARGEDNLAHVPGRLAAATARLKAAKAAPTPTPSS